MPGFLKTEPLKVVAVVVAGFTLLASLGVDLPAKATDATAVAIPVVMGAIAAAFTRPIKVPVVVAGITAAFTAAAAWGLDLPGPDDAATLNGVAAFLTAGAALLIRMGVSPTLVLGPVDDFSADDDAIR